MAFMRWPPKDPGDTLDYSIDWSRWLAPNDYIIASTWFVPAGLVIGTSTYERTLTTAWISGVGDGPLCDVQNQIQTSQGRTCTKTVTLPLGSGTQ